MPKSSNQKLKLLYLRRILLEETDDNHHLNAEQLVSKLEQLGINADRKTIYADVAALQDYGMDIFLQRGPGGGYSVSSREFELPELKLLVDAIQCSRFITEKKSRELIGKIESLASREEARQLQRQVYVSDRLKNIDEKIYYNIDALHRAVSSGVKIRFLYFNWALDFTRRDKIYRNYRHDGAYYCVSPWALTWDNEGLITSSPTTRLRRKARASRNYRVDKMENVQLTEEKREGAQHFRGSFSPAAYSREMFGMFSGHEEIVRLRCRKDAINILRDRFGSELMVQPDDSTHFFASVTVAVSPQFYAWVVGLNGAVRIVAPQHVCDSFRKLLLEQLEANNRKQSSAGLAAGTEDCCFSEIIPSRPCAGADRSRGRGRDHRRCRR